MSGNNNSGRKAKWMTISAFEEWKNNDFHHLAKDVKFHRKLLLGILCAVIILPTVFMVAVVQLLGN